MQGIGHAQDDAIFLSQKSYNAVNPAVSIPHPLSADSGLPTFGAGALR
jgi:hypothetical protein